MAVALLLPVSGRCGDFIACACGCAPLRWVLSVASPELLGRVAGLSRAGVGGVLRRELYIEILALGRDYALRVAHPLGYLDAGDEFDRAPHAGDGLHAERPTATHHHGARRVRASTSAVYPASSCRRTTDRISSRSTAGSATSSWRPRADRAGMPSIERACRPLGSLIRAAVVLRHPYCRRARQARIAQGLAPLRATGRFPSIRRSAPS